MTMTKEEILRDYKTAKDPRAQVKILADLNLCKSEDIITILKEMGEDGRQFNGLIQKKPKKPNEDKPKPAPEKSTKAPAKAQACDAVNHPSHYTDGKIEVIDYIEDKQLNYHLGNAVKYISRAGKKDPTKKVEDLRKAAWYINREVERLTKEGTA